AQRGHRSRLSPKPLDEGGVTGPGVQQNLDRDVPVENDIAAPPNLAHATAADQFAQYVPIVQNRAGGHHGGFPLEPRQYSRAGLRRWPRRERRVTSLRQQSRCRSLTPSRLTKRTTG